MKKAILIILVIIGLLAAPALFKKSTRIPLKGPELSGLNYEEISFMNSGDQTLLAGMLFRPPGEGPFPAAVIIHGSGPSHRNNPWYLSVAAYLQNNGIAVLLPDKRGCEKSEGQWVGADFKILAADTLGAVEFIRNQKIFNLSEIGLIGMSQGGWIAPVAENLDGGLDFIVNMSGAMVTTDEQLEFEEFNNISPWTYNFIARLIAPITTKNLKKAASLAPLMGFDPIPFWKKVNAPVFIAYGEGDTNCPVDDNLKQMKNEKLEGFFSKVYQGGGHGIQDPSTGKVSPLFLEDLVRFINQSRNGLKK